MFLLVVEQELVFIVITMSFELNLEEKNTECKAVMSRREVFISSSTIKRFFAIRMPAESLASYKPLHQVNLSDDVALIF